MAVGHLSIGWSLSRERRSYPSVRQSSSTERGGYPEQTPEFPARELRFLRTGHLSPCDTVTNSVAVMRGELHSCGGLTRELSQGHSRPQAEALHCRGDPGLDLRRDHSVGQVTSLQTGGGIALVQRRYAAVLRQHRSGAAALQIRCRGYITPERSKGRSVAAVKSLRTRGRVTPEQSGCHCRPQ